MEFIDVLTDNGEPTGIIRSRVAVHQNGDLHRTVHIWISNSDGEVLLQKRSQTKENHPGLWDMACAGHISSGETSLEAALKELKEELGIEFQPQDLRYLFSEKSEFVLQNGQYIDREIHDIYLITKNIPISSFKIQKSEVEDLNYVSISVFCHQVIEKDPRLVPQFSEFLKVIEYLKSCS